MIQSVSAFIDYFGSIRRRTLNYARVIPALDWQPKAGEYTCGDILRHLAAAETMYVGVVLAGKWLYPGHERQPEDTLEILLARMDSGHADAMNRLSALPDSELYQPRPSLLPDAPPVKVWRWLMAMTEHEIHHRSQLASYLTLMGVEPPQIYGVGVEELITRAVG